MAGRGPQTFKKRQKEQQRKEKQEEKAAKKVQRKLDGGLTALDEANPDDDESTDHLDRMRFDDDDEDSTKTPDPSAHNV